VATRSSVLGLEIAVDNGQLKALAAAGLASCGVWERLDSTDETRLEFAVFRAAITAHLVGIIAVLARIQVAVAAGRGASLVVAGGVAATRLLGAGLRAALSVPVKEAVLVLAGVAQLARLDHAVSANRLGARLAWRGAIGARLLLAGARTAVAADGVPVVTGLAAFEYSVATERYTGLSGHATLPTSFHRRLAISWAAVAADGVPVVAGFVRSQYPVSTFSLINAGLARRVTLEVSFDLAHFVAAVAVVLVAVIALLAQVLVQNAVAAFLIVNLD
jgi:hypothetical protein